MNNFWIVILVIFEIGQFADDCNALQHNLFYGNCVYDNNTMPIYTQLVTMDNLRPPTAVRPRRWYDYVLHPFRRHSTTPSPTSSPPSASFRHGNIINTTIVYPPHVSISSIVLLVKITYSVGSTKFDRKPLYKKESHFFPLIEFLGKHKFLVFLH